MEDQQDDGAFDDQGASRNGASDHHEDDQPDAVAGGDDLYASLTQRQHNAIIALVTEPTIAQAAKTAEVGERTLHRWIREPNFSKAYRSARRESFSQALSLAQRYTPLAVNTLAKLVSDSMTPASSRVSACMGILKFGRDSIELDDLAARIENLERATNESSRRTWGG